MKLAFPSAAIFAMAFYGSSSLSSVAAFSNVGRIQFGRTLVSNAAKNVASLLPMYYGAGIGAGVDAANLPINNRRAFTSTSTSATAMNMANGNKSFETWTFDEPCGVMEFSELASASISITQDLASVDDSDLIIVGIQGPEKDEGEEDGEDKDDEAEDEEVPQPTLTGKAKELDESMGGALTDVMMENFKDFKHGAKAGGTTPVLRLVSPGSKAKRVVLMGLGNEGKDIEGTLLTKIGSTIASQCNSNKKVKTCSITFPSSFPLNDVPLSDLSAEFYNTLYSDNRYRTGDKVTKQAEDLESVSIAYEGSISDSDAAAAAIESGKGVATGLLLTKDIVNAPHNVLNSESLANAARRIADESGGTIKCTVLGKEECEERGMGAFLGVARGSETAPQFIHLVYTPKSGDIKKKVGIVGKGLLFDTGGYNIKTAMMELMKFDCGGSAAVLGAARAVGELAPEGVEAHFIVAACENMINEKAYVPSDILIASNGKTIEIINTDAEGRLTLADALVYADKEVGCESIIELSTLTGACMVSLGKKICGVWTDDDDLASELADVSKVTGDKSWRMPMEKEYNEQLKSKIADMTNCGTRYGGAITAALFLQNFVSSKKPFAHIDIAGPVWDDSTGATGFGAKMVTEWVARQGQEKSSE